MVTATRPEMESQEEWSFWWKRYEGLNRCSRCGGFMVMEPLADLPAHRCVQCGEVVDPVILQNRQRGITVRTN